MIENVAICKKIYETNEFYFKLYWKSTWARNYISSIWKMIAEKILFLPRALHCLPYFYFSSGTFSRLHSQYNKLIYVLVKARQCPEKNVSVCELGIPFNFHDPPPLHEPIRLLSATSRGLPELPRPNRYKVEDTLLHIKNAPFIPSNIFSVYFTAVFAWTMPWDFSSWEPPTGVGFTNDPCISPWRM